MKIIRYSYILFLMLSIIQVPSQGGSAVSQLYILAWDYARSNMLELNTEKEGFMAYTAPEGAQRPRAVYAIDPDFRGI